MPGPQAGLGLIMDELRVFLFGEPRACFGSGPYLTFPTAKSLELLAFATLNRAAPLPREHVATALRPDTTDSRSRRALSTDIWRLRRLLDDHGHDSCDYLLADRRYVGIRRDAPLYLDVMAFESVVDRITHTALPELTRDDAASLAEAVDLFEGDLLANLDGEWCALLREELRAKHHAALDSLISLELAADNWATALGFAERLIQADALLEHAHRAAMQCHFLMGNRAAALRQYARCADLLDRELGVAPSDETQRMHRGLLAVPSRPVAAVDDEARITAGRSAPATALRDQPLTDQLSMALSNLNNARRLIENVDTRLRSEPVRT